MAHPYGGNMKISLALFIALVLFSYPAQSDDSLKEKFRANLSAIQKQINQLAEINALWRDTEKLVQLAILQSDSNDYQSANQSLNDAEHQAKQSRQQATIQSNSDLNTLMPPYLQH